MKDSDGRLLSPQSGLEEILALEARRVEAILASDAATLKAMTAAGYIHVDTHGRVRSRREFLENVTRKDRRFESLVIDENSVQLFGAAAIVSGRYHTVVRTEQGLRQTKQGRHIRVYVQEHGSWQNFAHQATEIKEQNSSREPMPLP